MNQSSDLNLQPALVVSTNALTKRYGAFTALENLNLQIEAGSIFGFIGPNGAGKTTTMRILATLLQPTAGTAEVCGLSILDLSKENQKEIKRQIGYMPDFFGVYENMKVWEYLEFFAAAYYIQSSKLKGIIGDLLTLVDLEDKRDEYVESLSRGMKQRLSLARCLMHDPRLLILDEPASGLDPRARVELRELLKELGRMGKTVLISSHILTELAEMCSHVGIIEQGRLRASGRVSDILSNLPKLRRVVVAKLKTAPQYLQTVSHLISQGPQVRSVRLVEDEPQLKPDKEGWVISTWEIEVEGQEAEFNGLLRYLIWQNIPLFSFSEHEINLEEIFLRITQTENV